MAARRSPTAPAAALPARRPLPDRTARPLSLRALLPTWRSLLAAALLVAGAGGAYLLARDSSMFAVRTIAVRGGTPRIRAQVERALAGEEGRSLLRVGGAAIGARLQAVPEVRAFRFDRRFPHTLDVVVRAERPVLVLRQGAHAYLVSGTGRVLRPLPHPRLSGLPRLWVTRAEQVTVGAQLSAAAARAAAAAAPLRTFSLPLHVATVVSDAHGLTLRSGGGFEVRLGDAGDIRLKLAIAGRILRETGAAAGPGYLDVSVPERPVLSTTDSRVSG